MKKFVAATLAICSALIATQSVEARNSAKDGATTQQHHSGNGNALLLGDYSASCFLPVLGAAEADTRNATVNGHSQLVVHLKAQGAGAGAHAYISNLDTVTTVLNSPITFSVVKGNAKYLQIILDYIPRGGSQIEVVFLTPDTKRETSGTSTLIDNGNGNYSVPVGSHGIPQGAQLTFFEFDQSANPNNCNAHVSDINHVQLNRAFVGISADPSSSCDAGCGGNGGVAE